MATETVAAIVIPVYATPENHRLDFLGQTLLSVQHQTYPNLVAVVVDDGSPADVAGFVQEQHMDNVRYVRRTRSPTDLKTASNALNFGIDLCLAGSGEVLSRSEASGLAALAYLHSDDLLPPVSVQKRISFLTNNVAFVHGDSLIVRRDNSPVRVQRWKGSYASSSFYNFPHHTVMWTAEFARQLKSYVAGQYSQEGIFDKRLSHGEDRDVSVSSAEAARIAEKRIIQISEILYVYKQHEKSISGEKLSGKYMANQRRLIAVKHFSAREHARLRLMAVLQNVTADLPWSLGYSLPEGVKGKARPIRDFVKGLRVKKILSDDELHDIESLLSTLSSR